MADCRSGKIAVEGAGKPNADGPIEGRFKQDGAGDDDAREDARAEAEHERHKCSE